MSLRAYLVGLGAISGVCWLAWLLTLVNTNPAQGGQAALLSFYFSLLVALVGTLTLAGYFVRLYFSRNELKFVLFRQALRQAWLLGGLLVTLLVLQSIRLVSWWDILLLIAVAFLLELYLRSNARRINF